MVIGGYISVPPETRSGGSERGSRTVAVFGPIRLLCTVGAFWPLRPMPMSGINTRASSKLNMGFKAVDTTGSHQNGKHLLGPIPGQLKP